MNKTDHSIEELTAKRIKKLGLDEPSANFTLKVMEHITLEKQPEILSQRINFWWFALTPVLAGITWYALVLLKPMGYFNKLWLSVLNFFQTFIDLFLSLVTNLKSISISPLLLVGFTAIFSLMTLEEIVHRMKRTM
jgi:hypothetical protein